MCQLTIRGRIQIVDFYRRHCSTRFAPICCFGLLLARARWFGRSTGRTRTMALRRAPLERASQLRASVRKAQRLAAWRGFGRREASVWHLGGIRPMMWQ